MSNYIVRFNLQQRIEHFVTMVTFALLCLTGLPQKFYTTGWAHVLVDVFGGVDATRWIHRITGIVLAVSTVVHFTNGILIMLSKKQYFSMVPTKKDFEDAILQLRYYLGMTDKHPMYDRYTYKEKFEYWGLVVGNVIMVMTGFILFFPVKAATLIPGQIIPAAKVAHSNEGLMAFFVITIWHIFNAHLNPDVFPFDASIFTGKVARERYLHEHPLELARLEGGPLAQLHLAGPDPSIVERAVSAVRDVSVWPMHARREGLVYRPLHWPQRVPLAGRLIRRWNRRALRRELDSICPPGPRFVCYDSSTQNEWVGQLGEQTAIYLAIDDRTLTVTGEPISGEREAEQELLAKVDLVACVSERLADVLRKRAPDVDPSRIVVLENGFDERIFDPHQAYPEPAGLRDIPRPRGLVAGHVSERIDWRGIESCRRLVPEVQWVFLGPADAGMVERIGRLGCHFRASVALEEVPAWIAHCDFGAVPYRRNLFTDASCPLKALEFLAMGLPTLATPVPSLEQFGDKICFVGEADGESYATAARALLPARPAENHRSPFAAVTDRSIGRQLELFLSLAERSFNET